MADMENQIAEAELHDEDVMEEAHDPKKAPEAGVAAADKADSVTKQAAAPKTKAGMINAMYSKMEKMKNFIAGKTEEVEGKGSDLLAKSEVTNGAPKSVVYQDNRVSNTDNRNSTVNQTSVAAKMAVQAVKE